MDETARVSAVDSRNIHILREDKVLQADEGREVERKQPRPQHAAEPLGVESCHADGKSAAGARRPCTASTQQSKVAQQVSDVLQPRLARVPSAAACCAAHVSVMQCLTTRTAATDSPAS